MNLKNIVEPKSIALYGVSKNNKAHPANIILKKNSEQSDIKIFCVNPSGGDYHGFKLYKSASELPQKADAAVFVVRADQVAAAMSDCADAGIKGGIVISGGFSEAGRPDLQVEIQRVSKEKKFPIIGPNGLGVYSPPGLNTFFFHDERFVKPPMGKIGLVSQSGGILVDLMIRFTQENVGISRALSIGNKAIVDEVDSLKFFIDDPRTDVIGIYFEGFLPGRGRDFIKVINSTDKPVVIYKAGKTPASASAISSHTAAVAGEYPVFKDIISQTRAVEVDTEPDFLSACEGLASWGRKKIEKVAIVTMSGGHGVIATDYLYNAGIQISKISPADSSALREKMSPNIRAIASFTNPFDLTGSAIDDDFLKAAEFAIQHPDVDAVFMLFLPFIPALTSALPPRLADLKELSGKPIVCYVPYLPKFGVFIEGFEANGIPVSHSIDGAVTMLAAIGGCR